MLLESIVGLYKGDSGGIYLNGKDTHTLSYQTSEIGFVYQDYCLFNHMSVRDNIGFGLKMRKCDKRTIDRLVGEIAENFNISDILDKSPLILSGGEKQRTALCRALVINPKVLLLDEPFSAMDPNTKNLLIQTIKNYKKKYRGTIVLVTHDFQEAIELADTIHIMVKGKLKATKSPSSLFTPSGDYEVDKFLQCTLKEQLI
jgi:molybdate transport system ATP-binding protein